MQSREGKRDSFVSGTNGEACVSQLAPTAPCLNMLEQSIPALAGKSGRQVIEDARAGDTPASIYVKSGSLIGGMLDDFI